MSARFAFPAMLALTGVVTVLAGNGAPKTGTDGGWKQHDIHRTKPPVVEPAPFSSAPAPKDAVVLFDGRNLDAWRSRDGGRAEWKVADGYFEVTPGTGPIHTTEKFGDIQLHVEWASPNPAKGSGQDRGNCGVFLMSTYEVQVLDSYKADTYADGQAGALYGQYPPIFNASRPPGEWQSYDIAFRRPRFDDSGKVLEPARVTLFHNGILVQNNEELLGQTNWLKWTPYQKHADELPIELQDHGHPVRFRNFWLRELPERPAPTPEALKRPKVIALSDQALDAFAGSYVMGTGTSGPKVTIAKDGNHLTVKFPFLPDPLVIEPTSDHEFAMPHTDGRFLFQKNADGQVTSATFTIGDGERAMKKVSK